MTLSLTIIQIALIFLPGIIWSTMDARFGAMRERSQFQITLKAFLFGVISYALTFVIYATLGVPFGIVDDVRLDQGLAGLRDLTDEILVAVVIAFTSSILWLYGTNYKLFGRFLQHLRSDSETRTSGTTFLILVRP